MDTVDIPQAKKRQDMPAVKFECALSLAVRAALHDAAARWSILSATTIMNHQQVQVSNLNFVDLRLGGSMCVDRESYFTIAF